MPHRIDVFQRGERCRLHISVGSKATALLKYSPRAVACHNAAIICRRGRTGGQGSRSIGGDGCGERCAGERGNVDALDVEGGAPVRRVRGRRRLRSPGQTKGQQATKDK